MAKASVTHKALRLLSHADFLVERHQTGCPVCYQPMTCPVCRPRTRLNARCQVCGVRMHARCALVVTAPADSAGHMLAFCAGCRS